MTTEVQQDEQLTPQQLAEQEERDFLAAAGSDEPETPEQDSPQLEADNEGDDLQGGDQSDNDEEFDISQLPASAIEKLEAQMMERLAPQIEQKLSGRLRNIEGHIGGLKHNMNQLSTAKTAAEAQGAEAPTGAQMREAMQSGSKMQELKDTFPEFAEALEEFGSDIAGRIPQVDAISQRLDSIQQSTPQTLNLARQYARLDAAHPDWEDTINSEQYVNWLSNQPPEMQALTNSDKASDAIKVLDAYMGKTPAASNPDLTAQSRQRNRLESALTPTGGKPATRRPPKTEQEEFLEAFNS